MPAILWQTGDFIQRKSKHTTNKKIKKTAPSKAKANLRAEKAMRTAAHKVEKARVLTPKVSKAAAEKLIKEAAIAHAAADETLRIKEADVVISNALFSEFITKNIGKQGVEIVKALNYSPHTDDKLAAKMEIKVNEVRRMLNVLNSYGITKYDINKDGKGWLTFKWYLDRGKLVMFNNTLQEKQNSQKVGLQEGCNDFFYCSTCYKNQKLILPFDSAFELNFKCEGCGRIFGVLSKDEATTLFLSEKTA